jgi:hypothetical protein
LLAAWLGWEIAGAIRGWAILGPILIAEWRLLRAAIAG